MQNKYQTLLDIIRTYEKAGICLSGGAGSTLVAVAACEALGKENVVGITVNTPFFTGEDMESSKDLCKKLGIPLLTPIANLLLDTEVVANPINRCYYCKRAIINVVRNAVADMHLNVLLDGSSAAGNDYYGKGDDAITEYGIVCPLRLANINRDDVHEILSGLGMSYYTQPENACLATRVAVGEPITLKKIRWIRAAENYIRSLGFDLVRVRLSNGNAKIEVQKEHIPELEKQKEEIEEELKAIGFKTVEIDMEGFKRETASCL